MKTKGENDIMAGILYGAGVGPGDPELITLKAVRLIRGTVEPERLSGRVEHPEEYI